MKEKVTIRIDPARGASVDLDCVSIWAAGQVIDLTVDQTIELASLLLQAALDRRYSSLDDVNVCR